MTACGMYKRTRPRSPAKNGRSHDKADRSKSAMFVNKNRLGCVGDTASKTATTLRKNTGSA